MGAPKLRLRSRRRAEARRMKGIAEGEGRSRLLQNFGEGPDGNHQRKVPGRLALADELEIAAPCPAQHLAEAVPQRRAPSWVTSSRRARRRAPPQRRPCASGLPASWSRASRPWLPRVAEIMSRRRSPWHLALSYRNRPRQQLPSSVDGAGELQSSPGSAAFTRVRSGTGARARASHRRSSTSPRSWKPAPASGTSGRSDTVTQVERLYASTATIRATSARMAS